MEDWVQWGITTIVGILGVLGGRNWKGREYKASKDKALLERFNELFPYSTMKFIQEHDFGASFDNSLFFQIEKMIEENKKPDFFFLDGELEKLRNDFIEQLEQLMRLLVAHSGPVENPNLDRNRIPVKYDDATEEEMQIIREVHRLTQSIYTSYSLLQQKARRKL